MRALPTVTATIPSRLPEERYPFPPYGEWYRSLVGLTTNVTGECAL
jgi:hypothetical protein